MHCFAIDFIYVEVSVNIKMKTFGWVSERSDFALIVEKVAMRQTMSMRCFEVFLVQVDRTYPSLSRSGVNGASGRSKFSNILSNYHAVDMVQKIWPCGDSVLDDRKENLEKEM